MKRKRYSVEQIVAAVKQHEMGTPVADIVRKLGIAEQTVRRQRIWHQSGHFLRETFPPVASPV